MKFRVFISSVQKEFAKERRAIAQYIRKDALFGKFFEVFLFEETPAANVSAQGVYLKEAGKCDVYLGLMGARYGYECADGVSPTEKEYDCAADHSRHVLVFVKRGSEEKREPKESAFLAKVESERVRRSFKGVADLKDTLAASLVRFLEERGKIQNTPFDASTCGGASIADLSVKKMRDFVRTARSLRGFKLSPKVPVAELLAHLNLLGKNGCVKNAALPPNELIAGPMYLKGYIEKMGTGTEDVAKLCAKSGLPAPGFTEGVDFRAVLMRKRDGALSNEIHAWTQVKTQVETHVKAQVISLARVMKGEMTTSEMMRLVGIRQRKNFHSRYISEALKSGIVEMTQPDSPRSPTQKYRLTAKGRNLLSHASQINAAEATTEVSEET